MSTHDKFDITDRGNVVYLDKISHYSVSCEGYGFLHPPLIPPH